MTSARDSLKTIAQAPRRLLPAARWLARQVARRVDPARRRHGYLQRARFRTFQHAYGEALQHPCYPSARLIKKALLASMEFVEGVQAELGLIKGLQRAGFEPVVLTWNDPWLLQYYRLAGVRRIVSWDQVLEPVGMLTAKALLDEAQSFEELLRLVQGPVRVGRFAASTAFRRLRVGSLDLASREVRERLLPFVRDAVAYARASERALEMIHPDLALFSDKGYTPQGQLFDLCVAHQLDAITWNVAHTSRSLMLKRYTRENRDEHPASLSSSSWQRVQQMVWGQAHRARLRQELSDSYASGDWYSEAGTQFHKRFLEPAEIQQRLGLDPQKKTAVIFPHILWDGTFFWGTDLFENYEEWLVETVRAACANDQVNWIVKIHPANLVKNARDGTAGDPAEILVLRKVLGRLPGHLVLLPAHSEISTFSLFGLMDYCLTVRGTIGIEAASFGIPVLTAGTGRYDHKGFTIDSESRTQYLARLASVHEIPRLSPAQRELAERFAYGVFVLRPLPWTTVTLDYQQDAQASLQIRVHAKTQDDWLNAPDLKAFAGWVNSRKLDLLMADGGAGDGQPARVENLTPMGAAVA